MSMSVSAIGMVDYFSFEESIQLEQFFSNTAPVRRGCDYTSCRSTNHATCVIQNGKLLWSCSTRSDPICGSNGHTYSNACFLKLHTCTPGAPYVYPAYRGTCGTAGGTQIRMYGCEKHLVLKSQR